jgi:hypothetical protein
VIDTDPAAADAAAAMAEAGTGALPSPDPAGSDPGRAFPAGTDGPDD